MTPEIEFMKKALAQARKAAAEGEVPVGAVVVHHGKIIGSGRNRAIAKSDPTAHAEVAAIRQACRRRKNYRIADCELFVTLEPCAMCLGAVVQARIRRLIYGAADPKAGAVKSVMTFPFARLNHRPEITGGILSEECGRLLKDFFKERRRNRSTADARRF
ncbi:MAG: tRNA adenosine(34) deaminase TadA [Acidobacteriota bacterium]|nr:tRNA adenosine(34) deaminase TadA [Acidobacteriota bacterium]